MKPRHSSNAESEQIMADIADTRAQMDETISELSERLQPRHILDDVLDYFRSRRSSGEGGKRIRRAAGNAAGQVKEKAGNAGRAAYSQVRQHPLPALLIGAGLSMLLMESRRQEEETYTEENDGTPAGAGSFSEFDSGAVGASPESYGLPEHYTGRESADSAGMMGKLKNKGAEWTSKASSSMQSVKERTAAKAGQLRQRAAQTGAQMKDKANYGYEQSRDAVARAAEERPLMMGLGCLAIGVVAGMLIPSTRKEDEWVGPARDRLVDRSREAAQEAVNRGKHVAQTAVDAAKQEASEQGLTPQSIMEKTQAVAAHAKDAARDDAKRQQDEFKAELKQA
jgi:ElaB/YqjD/DUF883 family membrane-anchored ribosome-binding protein